MTKVFAYQQGKQKDIGWRASVPFIQKPKIRCVKIVDGIKHYFGWNRKLYEASLFDKVFGLPSGVATII